MGQPDTRVTAKSLREIGHLDAHHRFFVAAAVAIITFCLLPWHMTWVSRLLGSWNAFVYTVLGLMWTTIIRAKPLDVVKTAKLQDSGRTAIFAFVLIAACASVLAVGAELGTAKGLDRAHVGAHVVFSILTVVASWVLVHTVFTLRYAHVFYGAPEESEEHKGLNFPDECEPDYMDFAYFSFVIGMTSQVSDVTISSTRLRRLALVHGLIAFAFNVAIIGLSINMASGLFQ